MNLSVPCMRRRLCNSQWCVSLTSARQKNTSTLQHQYNEQLKSVMSEWVAAAKSAIISWDSYQKLFDRHLSSARTAATTASAELESTRVELGQATARGKALSDEVTELKGTLLQCEQECEVAVEANTDLLQQLARAKGECFFQDSEFCA